MNITYESLFDLGRRISYTDHILHFKCLFENLDRPLTGALEWGCGYSTAIFLDACRRVRSVEMVMYDNGLDDEWFRACLELFRTRPNWHPQLEALTARCRGANAYQSSQHRDYALIDPEYVEELRTRVRHHILMGEAELSFVDSGVYLRGDLAELSLQEGLPVVVAHDTANSYPDYPSLIERDTDVNQYGWFKIGKHQDYAKIFVDHGCGTTFWIRKDFPKAIEAMQHYVDTRAFDTA